MRPKPIISPNIIIFHPGIKAPTIKNLRICLSPLIIPIEIKNIAVIIYIVKPSLFILIF